MRIYDRDLTGAQAAETARAQESQKVGRGSGDNGRSRTGASSDRVEFSASLGQLGRALSIYSSDRGAQVQALAALYQSGQYRTDSAATSRAMVSEALSTGVTQAA